MKTNWRCSICNKILDIRVEDGYVMVKDIYKVSDNGDLICEDCQKKNESEE